MGQGFGANLTAPAPLPAYPCFCAVSHNEVVDVFIPAAQNLKGRASPAQGQRNLRYQQPQLAHISRFGKLPVCVART